MDGLLQTQKYEVQRLLGQCLLGLQSVERLVKAIATGYDLSGPVDTLDEARSARAAGLGRKTLGAVVSELLGSYLTSHEKAGWSEAPMEPSSDEPPFRFRMQLALSADDLARSESDLRGLVILRNNLVHHFLEQHDLGSLEGCQNAERALIVARDRIKHHFDHLRFWAEDMNRAILHHEEVLRSDDVLGFLVSGRVPWSIARIASALREASADLAVDGWTPVARAGEWVSARYPGEVPANYGCSSWRQVLHESRHFERRYFTTEGRREAWYRAID